MNACADSGRKWIASCSSAVRPGVSSRPHSAAHDSHRKEARSVSRWKTAAENGFSEAIVSNAKEKISLSIAWSSPMSTVTPRRQEGSLFSRAAAVASTTASASAHSCTERALQPGEEIPDPGVRHRIDAPVALDARGDDMLTLENRQVL